MNLDTLLNLYINSTRTAELTQELSKPEAKVCLTGLLSGQIGFVVGSAFKKMPAGAHVIVATDREEAAYIKEDLASLLEKHDVLYFPDSFRKVAVFDDVNKNSVLQRTEAVNQMLNTASKGVILVTYPEAIFEKVVAPGFINAQAIDVTVGEKLDTDFLTEVLVEYGFDHVDFVYEPGQFSIRGGIIDVYSYGNEFPYRVELFDTDVETIRTFNPATQLSERNISKVTIVPNINTKFDASQKVSLFDVMPKGSVVWIKDYEYCLAKLQDCFDAAVLYAEKIPQLREDDKSEAADKLEERAFVLPHHAIEGIEKFPLVEIAMRPSFKAAKVFAYKSKPQPSFNKHFPLLIKDLSEKQASNFQTYIFADSSRQITRFYSIFEDLKANVMWHPIPKAIHAGFIDEDLKVCCYTDHQIFERYHKHKLRTGFDQGLALNLKRLKELQPGDFVTHLDHGIGRYSGLEKININGQLQEAVRLIYRDNDILYVSINSLHKIARYVGKDGTLPKQHKLGTDTWANTKSKAKRKIKELAFDLIQLYAKRKATKGHAFAPDNYLQTEMEASFLYEDTPDQAKSSEDVKRDMERDYPMDRLVCGDVGFGKTEVALRAAFKAVCDGKQVAVLVPTTILALQHFKTFNSRFKDFNIKTDYINRFRTAKEKTEILKSVAEGKTEILIGTHAILSDKIKFKDLGLLIVDEEQKFGVGAKEKIRNTKVAVDTLTLTATPIPRTMQSSLMGSRELSVINTPPPNRQPIQTELCTFNDETLKESVEYEIARGGQVFFIHNRINQLEEMAAVLRRLCPDADVCVAHGQMDDDKLEEVLMDFIEGKHDVLVSTNIIETGLDIPNANTIIINNAHQFGLSDLHQLRGRVGRSNRKAFCYLFGPPKSVLTDDARKRLQTLEEFSDLGSGFLIAMRDLDIRGAGAIFGGEQSGFYTDIGYETYQKILNEAIRELRRSDFKELYAEELSAEREQVNEVSIETDIEMLIPDAYVNNIAERLSLYTELDDIENEEKLNNFSIRLQDRFGKLPRQVNELFEGLRLRWICKLLGFERVILKTNKLRCYFPANPQSSFYETEHFQKVMGYLQAKSDHRLMLKQTGNALYLVVDGVNSLSKSKKILQDIADKCVPALPVKVAEQVIEQ